MASQRNTTVLSCEIKDDVFDDGHLSGGGRKAACLLVIIVMFKINCN